MKIAADYKQSFASKISIDSEQKVGMEQPLLYSLGHQACANSYSHQITPYFPSAVPVHYNPGNNPDVTPVLCYQKRNLEQNQACEYPGHLKRRFYYPNNVCTQEMHDLHSQCPTMLSTLSQNSANKTQNSPIACPAMYSDQLQILPQIIKTRAQPVDLSHNLPISYHSSFQPIWTNVTPKQCVQPPRPTTRNVSGGIDCPPAVIQKKFSLMPEIPGQIFTLPVLQRENSASNNIHDQNIATSNLEQPKKLNKFEEFAKRSHYSKKNLLKIDIPANPPPKSLFPSYSTPPCGIVLRPLPLAPTQLPTHSNFAYFESIPGILSHEPYNSMGLCAQSPSYSYSARSPIVINQAMPQPATENSIIFQSGSHECNPIPSTTQAQFMTPCTIHYQPAMQNQIVGPRYQDPSTPIFNHGKQQPFAMQHLTADLQYQDPDTPIYHHETQYQPAMQNLIAAPHQNPNPLLYQYGTQASLKT